MAASTRRRMNLALNVALVVLLIVSFVTGWVASFLGLTEFGFHKFTSIALLVVALGHLVLHWRSLTAHMRPRQRQSPGHLPISVGRDLAVSKRAVSLVAEH